MAAPRQPVKVTVVNGGGGITLQSDVRKLSNLSSAEAKKAEASRLKDAAEVIANAARSLGAAAAAHIPAATGAGGGISGVYVRTSGRKARMAAPFEYGESHPLFGNRKYWYATPHKPYMEDAADAALDRAAEAYAEVIDDWAHQLGFK